MDFIYFLGRFHVLALHLPIGMLLLTIALDILGRHPRRQFLLQALPLCWAATALSAVLTVVLGLMHVSEGGFTGPSVLAHRNYGIGVAVALVVVWFLVIGLPALYRQVRWFTNAFLLFLVTMTGHYGGNLTHGDTYLVEYAPQPVRAMAGLAPRREPVSDIARADPWHDVVGPLLQSRCGSCHNADKQRGQLNISSLDALLIGGESGAVVLAGNAAGSDLYRRITLPRIHENFMPAEGKTPLTEAQVQILAWWIDAGMPVNTDISATAIDGNMASLIAGELGLAEPEALQVAADYPAVPVELLNQLAEQGWLVRPQAQDSNGLLVSVNGVGQPVNRGMLTRLVQAGDAIVELNLASTGMHDELLALLTELPALRHLNLANNGISDAGLAIVAGYDSLEVLNIYGNQTVTDAGLSRLSALPVLKSLYVWGTSVTAEGIADLENVMSGLVVHGQSISPVVETANQEELVATNE